METIITNEGFELKTLYVPPFTLCRGEYLSLNFPNGYDPEEERQIIEILTGHKKVSTVKVFEVMSFVVFDFKYTFFTQFFKSKKVFPFLKRNTNLTDNVIDAILRNLDIRADESLLSLGANEKKLLALEIVCSTTKNIIINCSGLDYSGMSKLRERMVPQLKEGTVIELNYLNSKGREYLLDVQHYLKRKVIDIK